MRRTKEDARQTRQHIIGAARALFARRGVSRTSLEAIARAAGVTRGAIYWHFANKTELFYAMREEVSLPIVDRIGLSLEGCDALQGVERLLHHILDSLQDPRTRQTFRIIAFKCEYVSELEPELRHQARGQAQLYERLVQAYRRARRAGTLRSELTPELAALETSAFLSGLVRLWLVGEPGMSVRREAARLVDVHVAGRRAPARRATPRAAPAGL